MKNGIKAGMKVITEFQIGTATEEENEDDQSKNNNPFMPGPRGKKGGSSMKGAAGSKSSR